MILSIIFTTNDEQGNTEFSRTMGRGSTWVEVMEHAVIPGLRALGYQLPTTEQILESMGDACDKQWGNDA